MLWVVESAGVVPDRARGPTRFFHTKTSCSTIFLRPLALLVDLVLDQAPGTPPPETEICRHLAAPARMRDLITDG